MAVLNVGSRPCTCGRSHHDTRLVVVTGGPGAGKTAVLEMALRSFCTHVAVLPEAASIVFGGGFPRQQSPAARKAAQRAIFHVEDEVEKLVLEEGRVAVALCDRGTVDGAAYWPGPGDLWSSVGTTLEEQLRRYEAVIHLRTPGGGKGYNQRNPLRLESAVEAAAIDEKIASLWEAHARRFVVEASPDFLGKAARVIEILRAEVPECCRSHVGRDLDSSGRPSPAV